MAGIKLIRHRIISHKNKTERNSLTRISIGGAIVQLMKKKSLEEIKVSEICQRAGVSRMTFYHYYETKLEALQDYFYEIIIEYLEDSRSNDKIGSYEHILFTLHFFKNYKDFILGLTRANYYGILINALNSFLEEHYIEDKEIDINVSTTTIYDLYFYSGALLNTFVKWLENSETDSEKNSSEKISIEALATIISKYRRI